MAGAILISLLIISFGVFIYSIIYSYGESAIPGEELVAETFNSQYRMFCGKNRKASDVEQILNKIKTSQEPHKVSLAQGSITETGYVDSAKQYDILDYRYENGFIVEIKIADASYFFKRNHL